MQITDVRIRKVDKEGKMKAVVSITIDDEFVVRLYRKVSLRYMEKSAILIKNTGIVKTI